MIHIVLATDVGEYYPHCTVREKLAKCRLRRDGQFDRRFGYWRVVQRYHRFLKRKVEERWEAGEYGPFTSPIGERERAAWVYSAELTRLTKLKAL